MTDITERFYIHILDHMFLEYSEKALSEGINLDLHSGMGFFENVKIDDLKRLRDRFFEKNLHFSVHAPFIDISPGSPDPKIADVAKYRIVRSLQFAHFMKAKFMICHAGSEVLKYGYSYRGFIKNSIGFWSDIKHIAEDLGVKVAIENTIEKKPDLQTEIVNGVNSPYIGYCLDIGHWNLMSHVPLLVWLEALKDKLFAAHIHDNFGLDDDHLALGWGAIDFKPFTDFIKKHDLENIFVVENHNAENALHSIEVIRSGKFF